MSSPIHSKIDAVFVHVIDLRRSAAFYAALLGVSVETSAFRGSVYAIKMDNGIWLVLDDHSTEKDPPYVFTAATQPMFTLPTDDIAAASERIVNAGGTLQGVIRNQARMSFFLAKDPDQNTFAIIQNTPAPQQASKLIVP